MTETTPQASESQGKQLQSPFLWRSLKCPVCIEPGEHRVFRVRQFMPKTTEADQHISEYKWLSESTRPVHPPYFALYFCRVCYFCDIMADFRVGPTTPYAHQLARRLKETGGSDPVLALLGKHTNYDDIDFRAALNMHYLAAYAQLLLPEDMRDVFKLGRLFLRIAWLFRERAQNGDIPDGPAQCMDQPFFAYPNYDAFLDDVVAAWPLAPRDEQAALKITAHYFEEAISADARFDEPKEYFAGVKLLMEILHRCDDHDHAYEMVRGIYNTGMEVRKRHSEMLAKADTSARMREKIDIESKIINKMMSEAAEMRHEILDRMVVRDLDKARAIAAAAPGANLAQLVTRFVTGGLRPEVVKRLAVMPEFKR